jgi:hypothetical protein
MLLCLQNAECRMRAVRLELRTQLRPATCITVTVKRGVCLVASCAFKLARMKSRPGTGSSVFVPRGTPHTYWNAGPGRVRYLLVMTSNIYRLIQEIHVMAECSPAALPAVFTKDDSELLDQSIRKQC